MRTNAGRRRWEGLGRGFRASSDPGAGGRAHTLTGLIPFHRRRGSVHSPHRRDIAVYLPPGYRRAGRGRYPVLYMHDGQSLFDAASASSGVEWEVDETAERLIAAGWIPPLIVVGIYNTPDRLLEYTPVADERHGGGGAESYARFLIEQLKPAIDSTYRTLPDREHTGVSGSSLGGLASLYLGIAYPEVFSRLGVVSPAVGWAGGNIVRRVRETRWAVRRTAMRRPTMRVWLDVGTREAGSADASRRLATGVRALRDALVKRGLVPGRELAYLEAAGAVHHGVGAACGPDARVLVPRWMRAEGRSDFRKKVLDCPPH